MCKDYFEIERSYRYVSYDEKYKTLKFTRPTSPPRGAEIWRQLYKQRTAINRVNAYLKKYFQLKNVRHRGGKKAKAHFGFVTLIYNASKLVIDRINTRIQQVEQAS